MKILNLNTINSLSPYSIWRQDDRYYFRTDHDISSNMFQKSLKDMRI